MERSEPEARAVEDEATATLRQLNEDYIAAVRTSDDRSRAYDPHAAGRAGGTGRYTDVWAYADGRWRCVAAH